MFLFYFLCVIFLFGGGGVDFLFYFLGFFFRFFSQFSGRVLFLVYEHLLKKLILN